MKEIVKYLVKSGASKQARHGVGEREVGTQKVSRVGKTKRKSSLSSVSNARNDLHFSTPRKKKKFKQEV